MAQERLAGQLLVAAPHLSDPNFARSVVYMLRHDAGGALGLVINRPAGEVPLDRLLNLLDGADGEEGDQERERTPMSGASLLVFSGGPVEPFRAFTLHSRDVMFEESQPLDDDIAYNASDEVLQALAEGGGPEDVIFLLGYAGWGPGQLEGELERDDWLVIASDPALVFSAEPNRTWARAVERFSTEL